MRTTYRLFCGAALLLAAFDSAYAVDTKALYPSMAPLAQYMMANPSDEIALARSAAPPSISGDAEIMTLADHGYKTAVKGTNGFVCLIERSWADSFGDPEFWNYNNRSPLCFNPAAAQTVLPAVLERTNWALSGLSEDEIKKRTMASALANTAPALGAMSYMMSKQGHLNDAAGHWHPHVMFWLYRTDKSSWGADLPGSPVFGQTDEPGPITTFFVPVGKWSDGTPAMEMHS